MENTGLGDQLDRSFEVSLEEVKSRAVRGVVAIMGRGFMVSFIAQISQFFLLAFMDESQIGVFWIVSAAVAFLTFFSDIGLAAALIQKKEKPTEEDFKTTFTVQQVLIVLLLIVLFIIAPRLRSFYQLSSEGVILLYALGFSLLLSSLKSIPSVLLERRLEFTKFIIPDLLESLVYGVSVVYFAWQGFGLMSFTYSVILRGIVGVIAIYILQPWMPGFAFSTKSLKGLFRFGIPYQINTLIALVKDRGVTLVLGAIVGSRGVGFLGTAERMSQLPLRQFLDPITKVTFPAFSRMQEHKAELENAVTRSLMVITFFVFPASVGIALTAPLFIAVIPNYQKWEPSLIPLYLMTIGIFFAAVTTQLTNVLMAIGKIKTVSKLIAMWAIFTIILVPGLGSIYGINGAALGYALVSSTSIVAILIAKKYIDFSFRQGVVKTGVASILMGLVVYVARDVLPSGLLSIFILVALGGVVYIVLCYWFIGPRLISDAKKFAKVFINK